MEQQQKKSTVWILPLKVFVFRGLFDFCNFGNLFQNICYKINANLHFFLVTCPINAILSDWCCWVGDTKRAETKKKEKEKGKGKGGGGHLFVIGRACC